MGGRGRLPLVAAALCLFGSPQALPAGNTLQLPPDRDNTLYESAADTETETYELSNGAGDFLFVGRTGQDAGYRLRRGLLHFDLSSIPAGATVLHATLRLFQSRAAPGSPPAQMGLHRALEAWGEGTSEGIGAEGQGNLATEGDATWYHRIYPDELWTTPGGDFAATASSTTTVGETLGPYDWPCTAELVADLQGWLDDPGSNLGWALVGGEAAGYSAHRFNSRQHFEPGERPLLTIEYRPPDVVFSDGFESAGDCPAGP